MADEISKADARPASGPKQDVETVEQTQPSNATKAAPPVSSSMDPAHRTKVERALVRKLDLRCSLFVLIYIVSSALILRVPCCF